MAGDDDWWELYRPSSELTRETRVVSLRQIVAYNMVTARRGRHMTQHELGERLEELTGRPWSSATVSAAETGWDGRTPRVRHFDVHELAALAVALRVPVTWFLVPPPKDPAGSAVDADSPWITTITGQEAPAMTSRQLIQLVLDRGSQADPDDLLAGRLRREGWSKHLADPTIADRLRKLVSQLGELLSEVEAPDPQQRTQRGEKSKE